MAEDRPVNPDGRFALAEGVVLQDFAGQALLVDMSGERVYQLNETGAQAAHLLVAGQTLGEALAALAEEYESMPEELRGDVSELLAELLAQGLVVEQ